MSYFGLDLDDLKVCGERGHGVFGGGLYEEALDKEGL